MLCRSDIISAFLPGYS